MAALFFGVFYFVQQGIVWSNEQPDYVAFKNYQAAQFHYPAWVSQWVRSQETWWQSLDGTSFEIELARLFTQVGYKVQRTGRSGDQGVDLIVHGINNYRAIVQCKAHRIPVGPGPVRDLYGTLLHHGATEAWLVSSTGFSRAAHEFSRGKPIRLLSIRDVLSWWQSQARPSGH